ncbi:hypothetical protein HKBW3S09_00981, partial [Candidatus Hakubella thermalkaliphila]
KITQFSGDVVRRGAWAIPKKISVVIPVYDEEENLVPLYSDLKEALQALGMDYEIIFVDDGSTDKSSIILEDLHQNDDTLKAVLFRGNFGKAAALTAGFKEATGDVVITMDGDLQDDPEEISKFMARIQEGFDLVSGWKYRRKDPLSKTIPSKIFNTVMALFTGIKIHDFNCGFKAYRREVIEELEIYGELHRFIPALVGQKRFRIGEVKIEHHPRKFGRTKYGIDRFLKGFLDFMTVMFVTRYTLRPSHFFGMTGLIFFVTGFLINLYITYIRITTGSIGHRFPLLMLGILLIILGFQLFSTGLLAEMITRSHVKDDQGYSIRKKLK